MAILDNDFLSEDLQGLEEIQKKSPREGKWQKDLTEALVEISEKLFDDDQKSVERLIGTGWEEAVCGWGPVSAMACLYPQKKQRRMKTKESTDCLLCLDIASVPENKDGTSETKGSINTKHKEKSRAEQSPADAASAPAGEELPSGFTGHCPSTAIASTTEAPSDTVNLVSPEEQRPNKEKNAQQIPALFTGKAIPICTNCYKTKELPAFSSTMLLPPLKVAAGIGHTEHMARRRELLMQQFEKLPSKGGSLNSHALGNIMADRRLIEVLGELPQELKGPESVSFLTPCIPKTPPIKEQKLNTSNGQYSMKLNNYSAPVGYVHARTLPSKRVVRQDDKCRRAKSDTTPGLRNIILPSLTVTRVEIPPKIKMC